MPMMPRRGRTAVSDAEMWGDVGRMVHRKVDHEDGTAETVVKGIVEQLAADRAAIAQLYGAIQKVADVVNKHDDGFSELDKRMGEQTRLRLDDHRLHIGAMTHVRTGVEDVEATQKKLAEYIDVQNKVAYDEIDKKLEGIKGRMEEVVPMLVEAKFASIHGALEKLKATESEMKTYLVELEKTRPEEGKLVFNTFSQLQEEVAGLKVAQQQQTAAMAGLSSATAAGITGLAASGLSGEHLMMLNVMKAQVDTLVATEQSRPCHCGDVDSNIGHVAGERGSNGRSELVLAGRWGQQQRWFATIREDHRRRQRLVPLPMRGTADGSSTST